MYKESESFFNKNTRFEVDYYNEAKEIPTLINFIDYLDMVIEAGENPAQAEIEDIDTINLMTVHSSKGLEFDFVFIIGAEEGLLPHSRSFLEEEELEEERRLCYVGITRAKRKLFITFAEQRLTREGFSSQLPSRFLGEIPQDICEYYSYR